MNLVLIPLCVAKNGYFIHIYETLLLFYRLHRATKDGAGHSILTKTRQKNNDRPGGRASEGSFN